MSFSKYVPPRKKKRVFCTKESPFPVPIESITHEPASADTWFYYTAYLTGQNVIVRHSGDINFLFKMGFFGKGNLSRSLPEFNDRFRTARIPHPADTDTVIQPRVQSRRVYKRHVRWEGKEEDNNSSDDTDSSESEEEKAECQPSSSHTVSSENTSHVSSTSVHQGDCLHSGESLNKKPLEETAWEQGDSEFWTSNNDVKKPEELWDTEADTDFWHNGEKQVEDSWDVSNEDSDFWNSEEKACDEKEQVKKQSDESIVSKDSCSDTKSGYEKNGQSDVDHTATKSDSHMDTCDTEHGRCTAESSSCSRQSDTPGVEINKASSFKETEITSADVGQKCDVSVSDLEVQKPNNHASCDTISQGDNQDEGQAGDLDLYDPMCHNDDLDGDVFVIEDSDTETQKREKKSNRKKWRPVLKKDPHTVTEHLQLSLEETFFLAYGLGCLVVVDEKQSHLNLSSLWQRFCSSQSHFLPKYIAYHYYRSKGWVPKTGLKFGCDFIVYKEGPPFYHGSYSVIVRLVDEETLRENPKYTQRNMSWRDLSGLNRITEHVAKELLLCYVVKPRGISEEMLQSPSCIPQFKVQEILVSRWVSAQERQEKEVEEFP